MGKRAGSGLRRIRRRLLDDVKLNVKFTVIILIVLFVPIVILSILFFRSMEQSTIQENRRTLEYAIARESDEILNNIENINMSTRFFLSDQSLMEYLERVDGGKEIPDEDAKDFYDLNIASLERMVSSNPDIYQIRVYADSDTMEEMEPILYRYDRMERMSWAKEKEIGGWKFDYPDTVSAASAKAQDTRLAALITPIAKGDEQLGVLEAAIRMETMFPTVYGEDENRLAFFVDGKGHLYCGSENREIIQKYLREKLSRGSQEDLQQEGTAQETVKSVGTAVDYQTWDGVPVLVGSRYIRELDVTYYSVSSLEDVIGVLHRNRNIFLAVLLAISVAMIFLVNHVVKGLLSRFYRILQSLREIEKGDLNVRLEDCGNDEMGELGSQINRMMEQIRQLMDDNLNRERLVKNSEIRALQNQINAHFIYNVLESIKMMAEIDEKYDISDAITSLGKLLRYSMRWPSGNVTVGEELEYIRNYLALINLRVDYEIYLSLNMPDVILRQEIPKMSLQPIVENSIYHGIEPLAENTSIYVKGRLEDGDCVIEITDAGRGMSEEEVANLYRRINGEIETDGGDGGIGLKNVQDRIRMNFGEKYGLQISSRLGCYTKVRVRIPQTYFPPGARPARAEEKAGADE